MKVLVDTCVWSLALRRSRVRDDAVVRELHELIGEMRVVMIGAIRQELLCGIPALDQYARLRDQLRAFPDLPLTHEDYELAADFFNLCRGRGVQGSNTDFLLCAVAHRRQLAILTTDNDFQLFASHLPIVLHAVR